MKEDRTLNAYQTLARQTAIYPTAYSVVYPTIGLAGETGEVAEKVKKAIRDGGPYPKDTLKKELGDVLWYVSNIASDLGLSLEEIADANIDKLLDRKERGVLGGSGDNR